MSKIETQVIDVNGARFVHDIEAGMLVIVYGEPTDAELYREAEAAGEFAIDKGGVEHLSKGGMWI